MAITPSEKEVDEGRENKNRIVQKKAARNSRTKNNRRPQRGPKEPQNETVDDCSNSGGGFQHRARSPQCRARRNPTSLCNRLRVVRLLRPGKHQRTGWLVGRRYFHRK